MSNEPIGDEFKNTASANVIRIVSGITLTEGLFDQISDMVRSVDSGEADAETQTALKTMLDSLSGPCGIIWDQDDCEAVKKYAETLDV